MEAKAKYAEIANAELIDDLAGKLSALTDRYSDAAGFDFEEAAADIAAIYSEVAKLYDQVTHFYQRMTRTQKRLAPNAIKIKANLQETCELLQYAEKAAKAEDVEGISGLVEEARNWMQTNQELMEGKFE
jgi:galactose-1-phosphate uridylyltransferase